MSHVGLGIDPTTNDLYLDASNKLALVRDAKAVGEHVRQRLMTYTGEWFLDTTTGVPWLDEIMGKGYDPALAEAVVKEKILDTHGVKEITSFSVTFDYALRRLNIRDIAVLTVYDQEVSV